MTPGIEDFIFNKPNLLASLNLLERILETGPLARGSVVD